MGIERSVTFPDPGYSFDQVRNWLQYLVGHIPHARVRLDGRMELRKRQTATDNYLGGTILVHRTKLEYDCYTQEELRELFQGCGFHKREKADEVYDRNALFTRTEIALVRQVLQKSKEYFRIQKDQ